MTRPDVQPVKRKPLTKYEFAKLAVEQEGKCAVCGEKLKFEAYQIRDEHIVSLFGGGGNELSNRELRCVPCTKQKNADDAARHAKIRHLRGESKAGPKKKIPARKDPWAKPDNYQHRWAKRTIRR